MTMGGTSLLNVTTFRYVGWYQVSFVHVMGPKFKHAVVSELLVESKCETLNFMFMGNHYEGQGTVTSGLPQELLKAKTNSRLSGRI